MKTSLECLPCLGRNAVDVAKKITGDENVRRLIVSDALRLIAETDMNQPPPYSAWKILELAQKHTCGTCPDPYYADKKRSTRLAEQVVENLHRVPEYNPDSFESRLRLAIAGNILDFGVYGDLDLEAAARSVESAFTKTLDTAAVEQLHSAMKQARSILYILDNCGEAVFDRVFLEPFRDKITLGVRGLPAFNDVTRAELAESGLDTFTATAVDSGNGIPGVILPFANAAFQQTFAAADLVIAKGQGNFETLNDTTHPIAFLFLAKCPVVCREIGAAPQSIQVRLQNFPPA